MVFESVLRARVWSSFLSQPYYDRKGVYSKKFDVGMHNSAKRGKIHQMKQFPHFFLTAKVEARGHATMSSRGPFFNTLLS
jgi:hypothetical protein